MVKLILFFSLLSALPSFAEIPFDDLELLRQQTVAVRAALDNPKFAAKCNRVNARKAAAKLELLSDKAKAEFSKITLSAAELKTIEQKLPVCAKRASCSIYSLFLSSATADRADQLATLLAKFETAEKKMGSKEYLLAAAGMQNICKVLFELR